MTPEAVPKLSLFEDFVGGVILPSSKETVEACGDGYLYGSWQQVKTIKKKTAIFLLCIIEAPRLYGIYTVEDDPIFDTESEAFEGSSQIQVRVKLFYKFTPMPDPFLSKALNRLGHHQSYNLKREETYQIIVSMIDYTLYRRHAQKFEKFNRRLEQPHTKGNAKPALPAPVQSEINLQNQRITGDGRKIFFCNLDKILALNQSKENLANFSCFGIVLASELLVSADDSPVVSGWVEYQDASIAARAIEKLNGILLWGRKLIVTLWSSGID